MCAAATANVCRRISSVNTKICLRKSVVAAHHCGSVCEFFMSCLVLTFKSYDDNYVLLLYRHYECVSDGMPEAKVWALNAFSIVKCVSFSFIMLTKHVDG